MDGFTENRLKAIHEKLFQLLCAFKDVCDKEQIWYSLAFGTMLGAVRHNGFIPWDMDADVYIRIIDKERFREAFEKNKPEGIYLRNYNKAPKCLQSHDTLRLEKETPEDIHLDIYPLVGAPADEGKQAKFTRYLFYTDKIVRSKYVNIRQCKKKNKPFVFVVKILDRLIPDSVLRNNIKKRETKYDYNNSAYLISLTNYGRASCCMRKEIWEKMILHDFNGVDFYIPSGWDEYLTRMYGDYMIPKKY